MAFQKCFFSGLLMIGMMSAVWAADILDYKVQPEDIIKVNVYEQSDLDTTMRVSSSGEINLPLLGKVKVAGLTVREIEVLVTRLLAKDYLVDPQVQVSIGDYRSKQVSVLGAVNQPGKYGMHQERPTTVVEALAMAGGFSKVAQINGTRIIRQTDGVSKTIPVRVTDITQKGMKDADVVLEPDDVVFVPESFF